MSADVLYFPLCGKMTGRALSIWKMENGRTPCIREKSGAQQVGENGKRKTATGKRIRGVCF
jgi:hypothetical protein